MRYGIANAYFHKNGENDYLTDIPRAASLGYDLLEVNSADLPDKTKEERHAIAALARDCGVELVHSFSLSAETDFSSPDAAIRKAGLQYARKMLDVVCEMGGTSLGGINYVGWCCFGNATRKSECFENSVASCRELMKAAEDHGIEYDLELTNGYEQFLMNTAAEGRQYCEAVGSPMLKLLLDVNHMLTEEDDFLQAIRTAGPWLGHFHVAQSNRKMPVSDGMIPWRDIKRGLDEIGYQKRITLEPLVLAGGQLGQGAKFWRNKTADTSETALREEAKRGLAFIKSIFG